MTILNDPRERSRFIRFAIVGTIGAAVDFLSFNLFFGIFEFQAVTASILSFILALISNFILNRIWTFPDSRSKPIQSQMLQYGIVNLIGLLIRTPVFIWASSAITVLILNSNLSFPIEPLQFANNLALAIAIGVVLFWNFFANRYWTYNDV